MDEIGDRLMDAFFARGAQQQAADQQVLQDMQQLLQQPALQLDDHLLQMHAQLQAVQQLPPLPPLQAEALPVPLPPPQQPQPQPQDDFQQQALPPAQFHVHMLPAGGFMDGFAAIPIMGFAPFQPAGFGPGVARRRFAVPARAAAAAPAAPAAEQPAAAVAADYAAAAPADEAAAPAAPDAAPAAPGAAPPRRYRVLQAPPGQVGVIPPPGQLLLGAGQPIIIPQLNAQPQDAGLRHAVHALAAAADNAVNVAAAAIANGNLNAGQPRGAIRMQLVQAAPPQPNAPPPAAPQQQRVEQAFAVADAAAIAAAIGPGIQWAGDADAAADIAEAQQHIREMFGGAYDDEPNEPLLEPAAVVAVERSPAREAPGRIEDPAEQELNASCPICILPFKNNADGSRVARVLSCGHLICTGCVKQFTKNLRDTRTLAFSNRAPCVVCQRSVLWRGLPECKAVGYLYEQLDMTNEARKPADETAELIADTRKRLHRQFDSISSTCHEMSTKIRKMMRKTDAVYDSSLEALSSSTGRDTMGRIGDEETAKAVIEVVEKESRRIGELEKHFNTYYQALNCIIEEITSDKVDIAKFLKDREAASTSST